MPDDDLVVVDAGVTVAFCPNGSAEIPPALRLFCRTVWWCNHDHRRIASEPQPATNHTIQINAATSRVQVVP